LEDLKSEDAPPQRRITGIAEFDRVWGDRVTRSREILMTAD
jgi:hypothetical protein